MALPINPKSFIKRESNVIGFPQSPSAAPQLEARPEICANNPSLNDLTNETIRELYRLNDAGSQPFLYKSGLDVVRVEFDSDGNPRVKQVGTSELRNTLAEWMCWFKIQDRDGERKRIETKPKDDVVRNVLATPNLKLPALERIVTAPVFGPNGELQTTPGYHRESRCLYIPSGPTSIRNLQDPRDALALIDELLCDFPFVTEADKAHAIALLLLPFARNMIDGPTPLHLIEKPKEGTGAGLLLDMLLFPALGKDSTKTTEPGDPSEWQRTLTAVLSQRPEVIVLDNIKRELNSAHLCSAITTTSWQGRKMGSSDAPALPVRCCWVATANNPTLDGEMARRTIRIRMDAGVEYPADRDNFRHPELRRWVRENRSALASAAIALVKLWIDRDRPEAKAKLGGFERWSAVMGGILEAAGISGFLGNRTSLRAEIGGINWTAAFGKIHRQFGSEPFTAKGMLDVVGADDLDIGGASEPAKALGKKLSGLRDQVYSVDTEHGPLSLKLVRVGAHHNTTRWRFDVVG